MKCRACGFDPVAVQSQLKDYLKGDPLPDEKFFIELEPLKAKGGKLLPTYMCAQCGTVQIATKWTGARSCGNYIFPVSTFSTFRR